MMNRNKDISDNEEGGQSGEEEETLPQHHQDEEEHQQIYSFLPTAQRSQYSSVTTASTLLRQQSVSSATRSSNLSDPEQLFPNKLFHMLHDAERQGFTQIVSWGKDSPRAFRVHKKREFESLVLPKYFKMTKYKSFTRQLHNYEFLWVRSGNDKGGYTHPALDRNDPSSCAEVSRRIALRPSQVARKRRPQPSSNSNSSEEDERFGTASSATRGRSYSDSSGGGGLRGPAIPYVQQQEAPLSYQQQQQQLLLPHVNFFPSQGSTLVPAAAAAAYQQVSLSRNPSMYLDEEKLSPASTSASMARAPHPHPLDALLEPRTIEEMLQDPSNVTLKPAAKSKDDEEATKYRRK